MIEIKNTGKKLVHIGKHPILPGETVQVSEQEAAAPAIKVFEKRGILATSKVADTAEAATEETTTAEATAEVAEAVEPAAETATEETTTAKAKTTRRKVATKTTV